jgi:hypothetical protein
MTQNSFFNKIFKRKPKTEDDIWRKKIRKLVTYTYTYADDIPKTKAYFEQLLKLLNSGKVLENEISDVMYCITSVEIRGIFKDYPIKINFDKYGTLNIFLKKDTFPYFFDIYKKSGLYRIREQLTEIEKLSLESEKEDTFQKEYFESILSAYAKVQSSMLIIIYDPTKIPIHKNPDDAWSEDDMLRIFIDKGIYVLGNEERTDIFIHIFNTFNDEIQKKILNFISNFKIDVLDIGFEEMQIKISDNNIILNPISAVKESMEILLKIAEETDSVAYTISDEKKYISKQTEKLRIVTCSYCSSKYPLINNCKCPNCGASYS